MIVPLFWLNLRNILSKPKILVIVGPTASGKTSLSLKIAKRYRGEILCVDSRTVYRGMDIGTAKSGSPLATGGEVGTRRVDGIMHWGLDLVDPEEAYSIGEFKPYAEKKIQEILQRGHLPILVGGTGLWIDAIVNNLDLPAAPPDSKLRAKLETLTSEELCRQLLALDPEGGRLIESRNRRRLIRALEVLMMSGRTLEIMRRRLPSKYEAVKIGLKISKEELADRIACRVDEMMRRGFLAEVRALQKHYGCQAPAMSGIGYQQLCAFVAAEEKADLSIIVEEIKKETRRYAKRQMVWFKRDSRIIWFSNDFEANAIKFLDQHFQPSLS